MCVRRLVGGRAAYEARVQLAAELRAAEAACWARDFGTHQLFATAALGDVYRDYCTELYGVLVWLPLAGLPAQPGRRQKHAAYEVLRRDYEALLAGRPVLDTLRQSFDALAGLVQ